jgi:single-stranded DNA-binding protein
MNETMITMAGIVVTDVKKGEARGLSVVSFRLLSTVRRWERGKGWYDADHNFVTITCWRGLADNVASSVKKGDPLLVAGRMRVRHWDRADREGSTVEIEASGIGHDLSRGTSAFLRHKEPQPERVDGDEQANQVRWNVEDEGLTVERAVLKARRADANGSVDLTSIALTAGGKAPAAEASDGAGDDAASVGSVADGDPGTTAGAARRKDRISTGA